MKKTLLASLFCLAALTACQKNLTEVAPLEEGEAMATFTVSMVPQTKATIDNDGAAAHVNRCILEVRTGDSKKVYRHVEVSVDPTTLTATFQLPLVISQTYDFLFWADNADLDATLGKFSDKYYDTRDLTEVTILDKASGNLDEKDAFFEADHNVMFTGTTTLMNYTLKRPFAQVNIVTTDLLNIKGADDPALALDELWPAKISVDYTTEFPTRFNVSTGEADIFEQINRKAENVYGCAEAKAYNTLNMDYIFVNEVEGEDTTPFAITKAEITSKNNKVITILEGEANIPLKRNYRTNIIGEFLTDPQDFKVTVDPLWLSPDLRDQLPAPAADPQGCTVITDPESGEIVAKFETGNNTVVVPEGVTKFITNPTNPEADGGAYNDEIESLTMPSTIELYSHAYTSFCKNIKSITWTCNSEHEFTIDMNQALYGTAGNNTEFELHITGLPKKLNFVVPKSYSPQIEYKEYTPTNGKYVFNVSDGNTRTLKIYLPAGWRDAGYPITFEAGGGSHHCLVYEDGNLVAEDGSTK